MLEVWVKMWINMLQLIKKKSVWEEHHNEIINRGSYLNACDYL